MKIIMNEDEEDETSTKKTNNKIDASSLSLLSNTHSEQSDLNIESSREENIQFDPLFLQVSICIRHENDVQIDCPISQLPTCLIDIIKYINSEDGKELDMSKLIIYLNLLTITLTKDLPIQIGNKNFLDVHGTINRTRSVSLCSTGSLTEYHSLSEASLESDNGINDLPIEETLTSQQLEAINR